MLSLYFIYCTWHNPAFTLILLPLPYSLRIWYTLRSKKKSAVPFVAGFVLGKRNVPFILRVRKMKPSVIISSAFYQEPELHSTFLCIQILDMKMVQNLYTLTILFTRREKEICFIQQEFIKVPEQQRSSRTDTASIHLSWSKSSGGVESVGFSPHSLASQTKHITGCVFSPQRFWASKICSATENVIFVPPPPTLCAAGSINSWLFRRGEINRVVPCGPHLLGKPWKAQNLRTLN